MRQNKKTEQGFDSIKTIRALAIIKHSLVIAGHRTSVSLEEPFWRLLKVLAARQGLSVAALVARIDSTRSGTNLSSAIRVHLLEWVMAEGDVRIEG